MALTMLTRLNLLSAFDVYYAPSLQKLTCLDEDQASFPQEVDVLYVDGGTRRPEAIQ